MLPIPTLVYKYFKYKMQHVPDTCFVIHVLFLIAVVRKFLYESRRKVMHSISPPHMHKLFPIFPKKMREEGKAIITAYRNTVNTLLLIPPPQASRLLTDL